MGARTGAVPRITAEVFVRDVETADRGVDARPVEPFPELAKGEKKPKRYVGGISAQWSSRADRVSCAAPAVPLARFYAISARPMQAVHACYRWKPGLSTLQVGG